MFETIPITVQTSEAFIAAQPYVHIKSDTVFDANENCGSHKKNVYELEHTPHIMAK